MSVSPACMSMYHVCAYCPQMSEEDIRPPGTVVIDSCEHHVGAVD